MKTRLLYWENTYLFESLAKIIGIEAESKGGPFLILDATIFYPQGGGQPSDMGVIKNSSGVLQVSLVKAIGGQVCHYVGGDLGSFEVGQTVSLLVDEETRIAHARMHTAGHLLAIVASAAFPKWEAVKGHHFPGGCHVEFEGVLEEDCDVVIEALNSQLKHEVEQDWSICARVLPGGDLREVQIGDYPAVPCGGTHIASTAELGTILVRKVKAKKGRVKVSYFLDEA